MAFDERLADRVRAAAGAQAQLAEKRMFGGIAFLLGGNMAVGVIEDSLIVRTGPDEYEAALARPHVREFDITGRPMTGWIMVEAPGTEDESELIDWVAVGIGYAGSLEPKA